MVGLLQYTQTLAYNFGYFTILQFVLIGCIIAITVRVNLTSMKKGEKAMANKKRKPTKPDYKSYIIQGLIDLLVGLLLILIGKLLD